jgi:glycosyltransferase involved in cell wall biosynthesis
MRFLMLNWRDPRNPMAGGAERVSLGYMRALVERGHEVWWFTFAFPEGAAEDTVAGIHIVRRGGKGTAIMEARRWCREQPRFDLVVDQHHGIPWFAPWWCGTNCVAYIHEVLGPIWDAFYPWPWNLIGKQQERWTHWLYRDVPFWTACESTRDQLEREGVRHVKIIRYGVDTVALPKLPEKELTVPLRLVVVSRLAPNKRIDHAIELIAELRRRQIIADLTIVGGGEVEEKLRAQVARSGLEDLIRFAGPLSEAKKDELLKHSHFLLHTSQREGWGLNVIEANAMGTPALVYPVAGLIESTLDNETGLVSSAETPSALADRVQEILAQPEKYEVLRTNVLERARSFHWSKILPPACDWLEEMARR